MSIHIDYFPGNAVLLEIGFILLAVSLLWFARILGELLEIIQKPPMEALVKVAAWLIIITFVIPHYIVSAFFYPNLEIDPKWYLYLWIFKSISFIGLLLASILALIASGLYYIWTSR